MFYMKTTNSTFKTLIVIVSFLFLLTGCLSDLEKPTGLEDQENNETVYVGKKINLLSKSEKEEESKEAATVEKTEEEEQREKKENDSNNEDGSTSKDHIPSNMEETKKQEEVRKKSSEGSQNQHKQENKQEKKTPIQKKEKENKPSKPKPKPNKPKEDFKATITHSIVIAAEGSYGQKVCQEKKYPTCPEDGRAEVPLPPTIMEIEEETTVLEALIEITEKNNIHMDYRGGRGATAYVQGMGNVYEFDRGQGSGWMYRVNGIFPDRGAGVVPLCDGDIVEWLYTTNLGQDLNADLKPFRRDGKCP